MRRLGAFSGALAILLVSALPAHGTSAAGEIDHVEIGTGSSVKMLYSLPEVPDGVTPDLESLRVDVDGSPVEAVASPVEQGDVERTAVLALDVSASMRGGRFTAAQDAAAAYLAAAPDDVAVGLLTFAGSVSVVAEPTTNRSRVADLAQRLRLERGTLLYDGLLRSLDELTGTGQRQVVLLTDGADTGDRALADVVRAAKGSGVTVDVVALDQSPADEDRLRRITSATGGSMIPADNAKALTAAFEDEARALASQVLIEFEAPHAGESSIDVSMSAAGQVYADSTLFTLPSPPDSAVDLPGPVPATGPSALSDPRVLVVGAGALFLGLAVVLALLFHGKPKSTGDAVRRQLEFYSSRGSGDALPPPQAKAQLDIRSSAVAMADQLVKSGGLEARITQRLTAAGLALTAAEWLLTHAAVVVILALVGLLGGGGSPLPILLGLALGLIGPWMFLRIKETRRLKSFNAQLADTLQLMSGGLSAGLSLPQAVDTVVREGTEPMTGELRRALVEQRLGVEIEDALEAVAERMQSKDFGWVVMAIRIQREVGGNLAELLNTVAATIREREYLRRQVRTLSAEGRLSAWILGGLPPVFALYLALTKPGYLLPMYTTTLGWMLTVGSIMLLGLGALWLKQVVKVEV